MHRFQRGKIFESDRCSWDDHFDLEIQETEYPPLLRPDGFLHLEGVTYWCPKLIHPIIDFRTRRFFNLGCTPKRKSPGAFRITCKSSQKSTQNHIFSSWIPNLLLLGGKFHWPLRCLLGRLVACHTAQPASNDIGGRPTSIQPKLHWPAKNPGRAAIFVVHSNGPLKKVLEEEFPFKYAWKT